MKDKELISKWEKTGLLDDLKDKLPLAKILEMTAIELVDKDNEKCLKNHQLTTSMMLPVITKLYRSKNMDFDLVDIRQLIKRFDIDVECIKDLHSSTHTTLDIEAEFCQFFTETYKK